MLQQLLHPGGKRAEARAVDRLTEAEKQAAAAAARQALLAMRKQREAPEKNSNAADALSTGGSTADPAQPAPIDAAASNSTAEAKTTTTVGADAEAGIATRNATRRLLQVCVVICDDRDVV